MLPQLNFTKDISRGDDLVYVFGSKLRQQAFTQAVLAMNALTAAANRRLCFTLLRIVDGL
ncbi:MAG: hypothetical protein ABSG10_05050 [Terracidiphilus sp.]|jgi:hypothetical protein